MDLFTDFVADLLVTAQGEVAVAPLPQTVLVRLDGGRQAVLALPDYLPTPMAYGLLAARLSQMPVTGLFLVSEGLANIQASVEKIHAMRAEYKRVRNMPGHKTVIQVYGQTASKRIEVVQVFRRVPRGLAVGAEIPVPFAAAVDAEFEDPIWLDDCSTINRTSFGQLPMVAEPGLHEEVTCH